MMCDKHQGCVMNLAANPNRSSQQDQQRKSPVAKIPWFPQPAKKIDFEKSEFLKYMKLCCPVTIVKRKCELFQTLNETFPFYLPKRYHAMECKELHLKCPNGQYWVNAAHFMYATHAHDHRFYGIINLLIYNPYKEKDDVVRQPVFNMDLKHTVLKNGSAECETAAEYLLEPWVLLQLLTQPIIMYQWAIALLAEAMKLHIAIVEIMPLQCPENVEKSFTYSFMNNLHRLAYELLQLFEECAAKQDFNHFVLTRREVKKLHFMLKFYLPAISFVVSDKCKITINALKRLMIRIKPTEPTKSTSGVARFERARESTLIERDYEEFKYRHPRKLFLPQYWQENVLCVFYGTHRPYFPKNVESMDETRIKDIFNLDADKADTLKLKIHNKKGKKASLKNLKKWEDIAKIQPPYLVMNSKSDGLQDSENGVIYNLICLQSDLDIASENYLSADVAISVPEDDGQEISLETIEETLCKVTEPSKVKFANYVQNKINPECFSSNWEGMPDYKEMGAEDIADIFQKRIKALVFRLTMVHNSGLKKTGPYTYYPEVLFIQYLLPCFVASFLNLDKDENASQTQKENYLRFLHELIKCYENNLFSQNLKEEFKFPFTLVARNAYLWSHMNLCRDDLWAFFIETISGTNIFEQIQQFLMFMGEHHEKMDCRGPPRYGWPTNQWHMYMFMFLCRIRFAAEKIGWKGGSRHFCPLYMLGCARAIDTKNMREANILQHLIFAHFKSEKAREQENRKSKLKVPRDLMLAAKDVSLSQLLAISFSMLVSNLEWKKQIVKKISQWQGPAFPLDPMSAIWHLSKGDKWLARIALLEKVVTEEREDPTLVTLDFAKSNKCYGFVLPRLTYDGKVKMKHPGEITFVPIKHCRWCGLADVKEFRLCPECKENTDYPDVNFFCSEECEKESLEKQHMEEHARFLMLKCGI